DALDRAVTEGRHAGRIVGVAVGTDPPYVDHRRLSAFLGRAGFRGLVTTAAQGARADEAATPRGQVREPDVVLGQVLQVEGVSSAVAARGVVADRQRQEARALTRGRGGLRGPAPGGAVGVHPAPAFVVEGLVSHGATGPAPGVAVERKRHGAGAAVEQDQDGASVELAYFGLSDFRRLEMLQPIAVRHGQYQAAGNGWAEERGHGLAFEPAGQVADADHIVGPAVAVEVGRMVDRGRAGGLEAGTGTGVLEERRSPRGQLASRRRGQGAALG